MAEWACQNKSCKSFGEAHPNCRCPGPMAKGGVAEDFCKSTRDHLPECQYFAGGGAVLPAGFVMEEPAAAAPSGGLPQGFELEEDKYGSLGQQALTAIEGVGEGIAGPVFTGLERASGLTTPEDMRARREVNPTIHGAGQVAGLVGSTLIPFGQGAMLAKVGARAGQAIEGASAVAKIGSALTRGATEMALLQSGDEVSKMIMQDPEQSFQTAIANVGLASAFGAGGGALMGSVNPLWEATGGPKLSQFAQDFGNRIKFHMGEVAEVPLAEGEKLAPGAAAADALIKKGMSKFGSEEIGKMLGKAMGAGVGGAIGLGHGGYYGGALGALIGEKALGPFFESILPSVAKPIAEGMTDGGALKAASEYGMAIVRGQKLLTNAMKDVFRPGSEGLANELIPDARDREKLQRRLDEIHDNPDEFLMKEDRYVNLLPGHGGAKGSTLGAAFEYLTGIAPKSKQTNPLDQMRMPTKAEQYDYENALNLAQQPALIFGKIKNGSITGRDIDQMKAIYPALYRMSVSKMTAEMVDHLSKGGAIPYGTRIGLSKFLGESLDSTMTPASIMAAQQATSIIQMQQPMNQGGPPSAAKLAALQKSPTLMSTRMQSSEERHKAQF